MKGILVFFFCFLSVLVDAQEEYAFGRHRDTLYLEALSLVKEKDYVKAREICRVILERDSMYLKAEMILARTYTWEKRYKSAEDHLDNILLKDNSYKDAWLLKMQMLYWKGEYHHVLEVVYASEDHIQKSEEIYIHEAKALIKLGEDEEARKVLQKLLDNDKSNLEAKALIQEINIRTPKHRLDYHYEYTDFSFPKYPRNDFGLAYQYRINEKWVSILRFNASNRFSRMGYQYETDQYVKFFKGNYTYLNFGVSNQQLFPVLRFGIEPFFKLPYSMEGSIGNRYLKFSNSTLNIFTASLGKYYKDYFFVFRTFITPKEVGVSRSISLETRKYKKHANNFWFLRLGYGVSPDADYFGQVFEDLQLLASRKLAIGYEDRVKRWGYRVNAFYENIDEVNKLITIIGFGLTLRYSL